MRNFAGNGAADGGKVPSITAVERIDKIGNMSALAIVEASETTAKDKRKPRKPRWILRQISWKKLGSSQRS